MKKQSLLIGVSNMQKALHPLRFIGVTQKMYIGTHIGKPAMDFGWRDEASKKCYAPFDCVVKKIYTEDANEVWVESKEPVLWADGTIDYMTVLLIHDDDVSNLYVGKELKQGQYFYDMGNKGFSGGVHLHLEVGRGKFTGNGWYKDSSTGKWRINNGVEPQTALMVTNDTILGESATYDWKRESEVSEIGYILTPVERNLYQDQLEVKVTSLRVRSTPNGEILGYINLGVYNILYKQENGDYTWYEVEEGKWIAYKDEWITLYPKEGDAKEMETLKEQIELLTKENKEFQDKISLLEKQVQSLKEETKTDFEYVAEKDGLYKIRLKKGEILQIKSQS